MAHELSFRREKYELRERPNSTWSNDWIKKLTFWPYLVRVLVLIAMRRVLEYCNPSIHYSIMMHLIVTPFLALKFAICTYFWIFFWILAFVLTCESGSDKIQYRQQCHHQQWLPLLFPFFYLFIIIIIIFLLFYRWQKNPFLFPIVCLVIGWFC